MPVRVFSGLAYDQFSFLMPAAACVSLYRLMFRITFFPAREIIVKVTLTTCLQKKQNKKRAIKLGMCSCANLLEKAQNTTVACAFDVLRTNRVIKCSVIIFGTFLITILNHLPVPLLPFWHT